jgi:hypothetical protein
VPGTDDVTQSYIGAPLLFVNQNSFEPLAPTDHISTQYFRQLGYVGDGPDFNATSAQVVLVMAPPSETAYLKFRRGY